MNMSVSQWNLADASVLIDPHHFTTFTTALFQHMDADLRFRNGFFVHHITTASALSHSLTDADERQRAWDQAEQLLNELETDEEKQTWIGDVSLVFQEDNAVLAWQQGAIRKCLARLLPDHTEALDDLLDKHQTSSSAAITYSFGDAAVNLVSLQSPIIFADFSTAEYSIKPRGWKALKGSDMLPGNMQGLHQTARAAEQQCRAFAQEPTSDGDVECCLRIRARLSALDKVLVNNVPRENELLYKISKADWWRVISILITLYKNAY